MPRLGSNHGEIGPRWEGPAAGGVENGDGGPLPHPPPKTGLRHDGLGSAHHRFLALHGPAAGRVRADPPWARGLGALGSVARKPERDADLVVDAVEVGDLAPLALLVDE